MKLLMEKIIEKTATNMEIFKEGFPKAEENGVYNLVSLNQWTNGFWPGILWLCYKYSKDEKFRILAERLEEKLDELLFKRTMPQHDVGFVWLLTSGINYKLTQNEESKRRILQAADHLAARFNIKGNFIRAWDKEDTAGVAIIDCMLNIPILFLASKFTKDSRYAHIAKAHADKTLEYFIDSDGGVRHQCKFDGETGELIEVRGGQGYSSESCWTRGAGWAIYGFAMMYANTGDKKYLDAAEKVSKFFINQLGEDFVPAWDFKAPNRELKDSSAGAVVACGMLEISKYAEDKGFYEDNAKKLINALCEKCGNLNNESQSLLNNATGSFPVKKEVDVGLIYGDYYLTEAIFRLASEENEMVW